VERNTGCAFAERGVLKELLLHAVHAECRHTASFQNNDPVRKAQPLVYSMGVLLRFFEEPPVLREMNAHLSSFLSYPLYTGKYRAYASHSRHKLACFSHKGLTMVRYLLLQTIVFSLLQAFLVNRLNVRTHILG
jgi:hypothetical protein